MTDPNHSQLYLEPLSCSEWNLTHCVGFSQVAMATGDVCSAGFVCPPGTMFPQQHPCPLGTWSGIIGAQNLSSCWPCPPGLYCNSTGLSQPSGVCNTGMRLNCL